MRNGRFYTDVNVKIFIAPSKEKTVDAGIKNMYGLSHMCVEDDWSHAGRMNVNDNWLEYDDQNNCVVGEIRVFARLKYDVDPYAFESELLHRATTAGVDIIRVESTRERDYYINDLEDFGMYDY